MDGLPDSLKIMQKIRTKISKAVFVVGTLLLIAVFYGVSSRPVERLSWHEQVIYSIVSPFQKSVSFLRRSTVNAWDHYFALAGASKQNDELKRMNAAQELELSRLADIKAENDRFRRLLSFKEQNSIKNVIGARVVANDPRSDFKIVTIDRGTDDGVDPNLAVIGSRGLVGRVVNVGRFFANVLLITDPNNAVDVLVLRSRARAMLVGGPSGVGLFPNHYISRLEFLERKSDITNGDIVITSGLDGVYPPGIPIGIVSEVGSDSNGIFKEAAVVPFEDLSNIEELLVVKK